MSLQVSLQDVSDWVRMIAKAADAFVFEVAPRVLDDYVLALPATVLVPGLIFLSALLVFLTMLPMRQGDSVNAGFNMVANAAGKAATGLCVLAFYGALIMLFLFAIMRWV